MYGQQKRNIIHKSSTAYEQDHSDQRDELAPFHLDRPLSKPTHWTFVVTPPCRAPSAGWPRAPPPSLSDGGRGRSPPRRRGRARRPPAADSPRGWEVAQGGRGRERRAE